MNEEITIVQSFLGLDMFSPMYDTINIKVGDNPWTLLKYHIDFQEFIEIILGLKNNWVLTPFGDDLIMGAYDTIEWRIIQQEDQHVHVEFEEFDEVFHELIAEIDYYFDNNLGGMYEPRLYSWMGNYTAILKTYPAMLPENVNATLNGQLSLNL